MIQYYQEQLRQQAHTKDDRTSITRTQQSVGLQKLYNNEEMPCYTK